MAIVILFFCKIYIKYCLHRLLVLCYNKNVHITYF